MDSGDEVNIAFWNASVDSGLVCDWNTTLEFMDFTCECNDTNAVLSESGVQK